MLLGLRASSSLTSLFVRPTITQHPPQRVHANSPLAAAPALLFSVLLLSAISPPPSLHQHHGRRQKQRRARLKMAELLMECEEEELEPWQQRIKEIEVDDDDDEPIFVREISSAKVTNTNNTAGAQQGTFSQVQNGTPNRGAAAAATSFQSPFNHYKSPTSNSQSAQPVPPMYQPATRPSASTAIGQSLPRLVCPPEPIKRPLPVPQSPRANPPMLQPVSKPVTLVSNSQSACRNVTLSAMNQPTLRPAASITGQPVTLNQGYSVNSPQNSSNNSPNAMYAMRPSTPLTPYQGGQAVTATGNATPLVRPLQPSTQIHPASTPPRASPAITQRPLVTQNTLIPVQSPLSLNSQKPQQGMQGHSLSAGRSENASVEKRPSPIEITSVSPKKPKLVENGLEIISVSSLSSAPTTPMQIPPVIGTTPQKNGAPFPRACPKCNIHFNLLEPLKRHMTYCCPDKMHNFLLGIAEAEVTSSQAPTEDSEKGKLIMLVSDFYYGQYPGNALLMQQEQKTYTTFRCFSCQKLLKNNIRFMNHMKHHLELEKQSTESWENHTTCHHCYRQFPTPFQLQCHIECSHTLYETTTICKICELSYESEQVLLQHMKDNHKPGEMPYVCQVCNFRSSSFSDVDSHFRAVHENTKCLLCPFCLKVIKCGTPFMQHYVKHQNKGVYRCSKCRLQFLTCKEKMDHKTQHHKTFKKPKQLEGLPPGTKITIRASAGSLNSAPSTTSVCTSPPTTPIQTSSKSKSTNTKVSQSLGSKSKPPPQKKPTAAAATTTTTTTSTTKRIKMINSALRNLGAVSGLHKCMECQQEVKDFENHFHTYVHCSKCKFSTSCSKAYMNHTMTFHGRNAHKRAQALKSQKDRRNITLVCLNCDFLADISGIDDMAKHLGDHHSHSCQVVMEPVSIYSSTLEGVMSKSRFASVLLKDQIYCKKESDTDVSGIKSNSTEEQYEQAEKQEESNMEESNKEIQRNVPLINRPMTPEDCDSGNSNTDNSIKNDAARKAEVLSKDINDCNAVEEQQSPIEEESRQTQGVSTFTDEGEKLKQVLESSDETGDHANFHYIGDDGVSFEQFLRRRDEPESVGSDISDQSSVHLEPLTPSEVLEHEATEILQKGTPQQKCSIGDQARHTADAEPAVSEEAPEEEDGGS